MGEVLGVGPAGMPRVGRMSAGNGRGAAGLRTSPSTITGLDESGVANSSVGIVVVLPVCFPLRVRVRPSKKGRRSMGALWTAGAVVVCDGEATVSERDVGMAFTTLESSGEWSLG